MAVTDSAADPGLVELSERAFSPSGAMAGVLPGFSARASQVAMTRAVAQTLRDGGCLVCEAGTGTGKTLAYLVPVLFSGRRVLISTGTRTLQDQLFERDLPVALIGIRSGRSSALLKGRANYLCLQRLQVALAMGEDSREDADELARVADWARHTNTGDIAEVADVAEDSRLWRRVTSTVDNCLGQGCPQFEDCHVVAARRRAADADIVIVNHHLFLADIALKEEGFGELLPGADAVILDEAHQLPDIATAFFGQSLSTAQLLELVRDAIAAYQAEAGDMPSLLEAASALAGRVDAFWRTLGPPSRRSWQECITDGRVEEALHALRSGLNELRLNLDELAQRGRQLQHVRERSVRITELLEPFSDAGTEGGFVAWLEAREHGATLHRSPLDIGGRFAVQALARASAWVFTSATLAVDGSVVHFAERLGLGGHQAKVFPSSFDYQRQSICYLPQGLPEPGTAEHSAAVVETALEVMRASQGSAFLLFTSHAALRRADSLLAHRCPYPLMVQGSAPRGELLRRFRATPHAVLLGTGSFWEGVDVSGDALSCVLIDKLPFAPPDDPLLEARSRAMRADGRDPFRNLQLPQAVLALKQGAGRLIRTETDRGVLVICDPRLQRRGYGRSFLSSLPPMPVTHDIADVFEFFARFTRSVQVSDQGPQK